MSSVERRRQIRLERRDVNLPYIAFYVGCFNRTDVRGKQVEWSGQLRLCNESVTKRRPQKLVFYECVDG
jgi:hypothetical protein